MRSMMGEKMGNRALLTRGRVPLSYPTAGAAGPVPAAVRRSQ